MKDFSPSLAPDTSGGIRPDGAPEPVTIIEASRGLLRIPWREMVQYRDLLFLLVRRDFVAQYKQTVLGPLWFILQPLITTFVFTVVFSKIARIPTDDLPPLLFYLCGMLAWSYFAGCLGHTSGVLTGYAGIFGKVYFPRLIVPLSIVLSRLIAFGVQLVTFLAFLVYFKFFTAAGASIHPRWAMLLIPALLVQSAVIGLGVGLWMAALTAKYRDFSFLAGFLTQLWMYATPVVYPLSLVPDKWKWVALANPMTGIVEAYRYAFFGVGVLNPGYLGVSLAMGMLFLVTGLMLFNRAERTFIDTV